MPRPRLNPKQRKWRDRFLEKYPYYRQIEVWEGLAGDRIITFEGMEEIAIPLVFDWKGEIPQWIRHKLRVKLRKFGDPRFTAEHFWEIVTSSKAILPDTGQIALPLPQVFNIPTPVNPVVVKNKRVTTRDRNSLTQLSMPVVGREAELFQHRLKYRPHLPPTSSQELLAEKVSTWSARDKREVELPIAVVDTLRAMHANDEEWQTCLDMYGVTGSSGAMYYAENLPSLRKHKGLPEMPLIAQSQVVGESVSNVKATEQIRVSSVLD